MIKNIADQVVSFVMIDSSDGSAITSGTVNPYVTLDGGTQAAGAGGAPAHEGNGQWSYVATQAETNADSIGFLFTHTSAIPVNIQVYTIAAAVEEAVETASATSPPLSAHMTELDAVNMMLRSIGESPVQSLASGQYDAAQAQAILKEESRRIQAQGWHANRRMGVTYTKNADNQFAVGVNVLGVDTTDPDSWRQTSSPNPSKYMNVSMRRAADNSKWLLYDIDNNSETWDSPDTLTVDVVEFLRFENLPTTLQTYIYKSAGHVFQKSAVSSQVLYEFTQEDVAMSMVDAMQDDAANADRNVLTHNRAARSVVRRYNPLYG